MTIPYKIPVLRYFNIEMLKQRVNKVAYYKNRDFHMILLIWSLGGDIQGSGPLEIDWRNYGRISVTKRLKVPPSLKEAVRPAPAIIG